MLQKRALEKNGEELGKGSLKCKILTRAQLFFLLTSATDFGGDVSRFFEVTVKLDQDFGEIRLGRLTQQYITDPDIRGLLEKTTLDNNKIGTFEDDLLLITSVIKSEKFEVTGERISEVTAVIYLTVHNLC